MHWVCSCKGGVSGQVVRPQRVYTTPPLLGPGGPGGPGSPFSPLTTPCLVHGHLDRLLYPHHHSSFPVHAARHKHPLINLASFKHRQRTGYTLETAEVLT